MTWGNVELHAGTSMWSGCTVASWFGAITMTFATVQPVHAAQLQVAAGAGGGPRDVWSWQSVTWSPLGDMYDTGVILRVLSRSETKVYSTLLPPAPGTMRQVWVRGIGLDGEIGWQQNTALGSFSTFVGTAWRDYELSPVDPNSQLLDRSLGVKVSLSAHLDLSRSWGGYGYAEYLAVFDEWYVKAQPFVEMQDGLKIGPEFSASGSADYVHVRAGIFATGYEVNLPWMGKMWIGGSAGMLIDTDDGYVAPYAGLHMTRAARPAWTPFTAP